MSASFLRQLVSGAWALTTPSVNDPLPVAVAASPIGSGSATKVIAAGQTDAAVGGAGTVITGMWIIPSATAPGVVTLKDAGNTIFPFPGGTLPSVYPFNGLSGFSSAGALTVTTGANVSVTFTGSFA